MIFTRGFLIKFGNDPDILATTLGHELAHHELGHTVPGYIEDRSNNINIIGHTISTISNFFVPFSGLFVGNLVKGVGLSYSRDDEREADNLGMAWAIYSGYSHCGSYRFASEMNQINGSTSLAFLSTHPGSEERMRNANIFALQKNIASCS
ncbi:M48 family metalloprotease [Polynucleobacter sphagniphilus]|uniref:M48 family metalloprotease n=1 Tax=Polynucleobacter sphagniphilus TaxID=1743169 RepID=UPI00314523C3